MPLASSAQCRQLHFHDHPCPLPFAAAQRPCNKPEGCFVTCNHFYHVMTGKTQDEQTLAVVNLSHDSQTCCHLGTNSTTWYQMVGTDAWVQVVSGHGNSCCRCAHEEGDPAKTAAVPFVHGSERDLNVPRVVKIRLKIHRPP